MKIDLSYSEVEDVLASIRMAAHEANRTANTALKEGYPPSVESEMASRASDLYLLADKIDDQKRLYGNKPVGSSGTIDPYDTPVGENTSPPKGTSKFDDPQSPNDPIEW